jgi:hypothetical protein
MDGELPAPLEALAAPPDEAELGWLWRAQRIGTPVAPMIVVPTSVEIGYYRLNNLPERLQALFDGVDLSDPDEDDLEEIAPVAEALVRGQALLAEVIEALFASFETLPATLTVRRSGEDGVEAARGTPALLALKRLWSDEWREDALARRLRAGGGLAPEPRPVVMHGATLTALAHRGAPSPGGTLRAWADDAGRLARVDLARG